MKSYLLIIGLLVLSLVSYGQNIYQIRADSVRIYNDCDTAELIIENHTQMVPGFLYNKFKGRTEFRRMQFIDLGLGIIAIGDQDTLDFSGALKGNFIQNQYTAPQPANFWVNGKGRIDGAVRLNHYKNNETEDSVLTTDMDGNLKMKVAGGGGVNIYNSDGELESDRYIWQAEKGLEFDGGAKFIAKGTYQNLPYRIGTYDDPMENHGLVLEYGRANRIAIEDERIRFRSSNYYYQLLIDQSGILADYSSMRRERIGDGWDYGVTPFNDVSLDVSGYAPGKGFRLSDGSQGAGKVLTSDEFGYAKWQPAGGGNSGSGASPAYAVKTVTSSYTATASDYTILGNNSSDITVTLPPAADNTGKMFVVKRLGTGSLVVKGSGTDVFIDRGVSVTIFGQYQGILIQSIGTHWIVISYS